MSERYFVSSRGKVTGPFDVERLRTLKARGQLSSTHRLSLDRREWFPAGELETVFPPEPTRSTGSRYESGGYDAQTAPQEPAPPPAEWLYYAAEQQYGPVTVDEIHSLLAEGRLLESDLVWREGMPEWLPIHDVPELQRSTDFGGNSQLGRSGNGAAGDRNGMALAAMWLGIAPWILLVAGLILFFILGAAAGASRDAGLMGAVLGGSVIFTILTNLVWVVASILAVVFGSLTMRRPTRKGLALTGFVVGIVNLVILSGFWLFALL